MNAKDWTAISRQGRELSAAAARIGSTEAQLICTLAGVIESIGRIGAAQAETMEKELADIKKQISKIKTVHGM